MCDLCKLHLCSFFILFTGCRIWQILFDLIMHLNIKINWHFDRLLKSCILFCNRVWQIMVCYILRSWLLLVYFTEIIVLCSEQVLHLWLETLCSCVEVVEKWYQPWSFMRSPGWVQIKCELRLAVLFFHMIVVPSVFCFYCTSASSIYFLLHCDLCLLFYVSKEALMLSRLLVTARNSCAR